MSARPRSASYSRIHQGENATDIQETSDLEEDVTKKLRTNWAEKISNKLHALLWVFGSGFLVYYLEFFHVMTRDSRVNRLFLNVALVAFGINCCITFYLAIWLPYILKIDLEWSVYCPRMIPTATIFGVVATLGFIIAFWPVWGLFTPGILFVISIGALMSAHFLPAI